MQKHNGNSTIYIKHINPLRVLVNSTKMLAIFVPTKWMHLYFLYPAALG